MNRQALINAALGAATLLALAAVARAFSHGDLLTAALAVLATLAAAAALLMQRSGHREKLDEQARLRRDAEESNRAKTRFLSNMSTELRTPLNVIMGFAQIQKNQLPSDASPGLAKSSEETLNAGWQLINLIDDILDISRIEEGRLNLTLENCKLSEVASHAASLVMEEAALHGVELEVEDSPLYVYADYTRLKQVLVKLFMNGIVFNRQGGSVSFRARQAESGDIECEVRDTGQGVPLEAREVIFSPFTRLPRQDGTEVPGTGMGLALTRFLADAMGGEVSLQESGATGSCFLLRLAGPQSAPETAAPSAEDSRETASPQPEIPARPLLLVYVEDHLASQELVKAIIDPMENVTLLTAASAEAGIELARQHHPDLMLMDINLHGHGMDGVTAAREMKASEELAKIPLVAVSADAIDASIDEAMGAGFARYLTKPLDIDELWQVIHQVAATDRGPGQDAH